MNFVRGSVVMSVLMMSLGGSVHAQPDSASGSVNNPGNAAATSPGLGPTPTPTPTPGVGTLGGVIAPGIAGGAGSGPTLNNMRANGTSLNMSPDPRAPNLSGRGVPPR